jgi:OmpA-OmpF porin, OOP family
MKCNPTRWLWGLLPVIGLGWVATQITHTDIEADLKKRVDSQLSSAGFKWHQTTFSGRDARIAGVASDEADPGRATDIARSIWGVRVAENQATVIDKVEKYVWSATRSGNRLSLGGYVPNDGVRADIVKQAKASFAGVDVVDDMKLARGVPSDAWQSGVMFGLKQLAGLKSGEAKLDGVSLALSGEAADTKTYRGVKTALANELPRGVKLADERVLAPIVKPFIWSAKQGGGQLLLSGYVPERQRADVLAAAKAAFPRATVTDRMDSAEGAAAGHTAAVAIALKELARLEDGTAEVRDTAMSVQGAATDPEIQASVRQNLAKGTPQGFRMTEAITARDTGPKPVSPYTTAALVDASSVVLTGYAPSDAARDQLVQLARDKFPGRRIDNRLAVAPGAPAGWKNCIDQAVSGVSRLGAGKLALTDKALDVSGATDDEELAGAVPRDIRQGVKSDCDANVRVDVLAEAVPELVWRASAKGNEVVLDGDVSSAAAKSSLMTSAQRLFPGRTVVDRMRIVETRTRTWPAMAEQGLVSLADLKEGTATLLRRDLSVVGEAADQSTADRIKARLTRDLAKGYTGRDQIKVAVAAATPAPVAPPAAPPPVVPAPAPAAPPAAPKVDPQAQACQTSLQATAREGIIRFERASAVLTTESFPTLNKLVAAARNCGSVVIDIEGHTDSEGTPERNQRLADRRAQSVVTYLTGAGVPATQLNAIGYGEARPIVPNDTAENRARNRRIEFTVKPR